MLVFMETNGVVKALFMGLGSLFGFVEGLEQGHLLLRMMLVFLIFSQPTGLVDLCPFEIRILD